MWPSSQHNIVFLALLRAKRPFKNASFVKVGIISCFITCLVMMVVGVCGGVCVGGAVDGWGWVLGCLWLMEFGERA